MTELRIEPFQEGDTAAVVALWQACGLVRPWNDPGHDIAFCTATPHSVLFVGRRPVVGNLVATVMVGHDGHRGWMYYLAVAPAAQGAGLGRAMVGHAEAWLEETGAPKVQLMIRAENEAVSRFYQALGYRTETVVVMSRWLAGGPSR